MKQVVNGQYVEMSMADIAELCVPGTEETPQMQTVESRLDVLENAHKELKKHLQKLFLYIGEKI